MAVIVLYEPCPNCNGTGTYVPGAPLPPTSCIHCGGDGLLTIGHLDITDLMVKIDYIHDKVRKIWNKIKDGAPEE